MLRLILICLSLFVLFGSGSFFEKQIEGIKDPTGINELAQNVTEDSNNITETMNSFSTTIDSFYTAIQEIVALFEGLQMDQLQPLDRAKDEKPAEVPTLTAPVKQTFSIYNIELGDEKEEVEHNIGPPKRSAMNEFGVEWHTYHENYRNFFMIAYDQNNKVAALYTNQDLISTTNGIKRGLPKEVVQNTLGEPLTKILKGFVFYKLPTERDYDVYLIDNSYVTVFYDKHQNNTVTAVQLVSKELEEKKPGFYADASPELKEGFEYLLFDLTNAARVNHGLHILAWDDVVRETARRHSADMAENNYFDHVNLEGQSPFDRMAQDDIVFAVAGENLAYGQFSSIFAHEGLLNSLGHRKNILHSKFKLLGIGVAFNSKSQPYFTQKYYTKR